MIKIFVTGPPGIGKTTCVYKVYEMLKLNGYKVGGFVTKEVREGGRRIGFQIIELDKGIKEWLSSVRIKSKYTIGKYYVYPSRLEKIISDIEDKIDNYDMLIIDEIGPMELLSTKFKEFIQHTLNIDMPAVYTVHHKISNELNKRFRTRYDNILYILTMDNREAMPLIIWRKLYSYLSRRRKDV